MKVTCLSLSYPGQAVEEPWSSSYDAREENRDDKCKDRGNDYDNDDDNDHDYDYHGEYDDDRKGVM